MKMKPSKKSPFVQGGGPMRRRRAIDLSGRHIGTDLVEVGPLDPSRELPRCVRPKVEGVDLKVWAVKNREWIHYQLGEAGAVLFRGFGTLSIEGFQELVDAVSGQMLHYSFRSTPRTQVSGKIYTSTEYPADQWIPMHNEMSYTHDWPLEVWFFCAQAAAEGGATPLADSHRVHERLSVATRRRFEERGGVLYVRNYGEGVDLPWENVFQTDVRAEVEAMCRAGGIDFEWKEGNRLRTRQCRPAAATHPQRSVKLWFNQAHLFHVSSLGDEVEESLRVTLGEDNLPRNTYYGDGTPIEPEVLAEIRRAFDEESIAFPWQNGDLLLVDNMMVAHGREPFTGPRRILVGMSKSYRETFGGDRRSLRQDKKPESAES